MIGILLLSIAVAEVSVTYTVPTHHISGQTFTLDLQVFNDGEVAESIQDLHKDRWAIAFTVEQESQLYKASSTKAPDDNVTMISLQPRGLQELRFEVPNSAAWKTGSVQLQIHTPFSSEPYRQEVLVHPHVIENFAAQDVKANPFIHSEEVLWVHKDALFVNPQEPQFLQVIPPESKFGTSIHLGPSRHIHWISGQNLYVLPIVGGRTSPSIRTTIPWPNGETMGPSFTDANGRYMIPIWVGNKTESGTLYMLILDRQGRPSFRKLFSGSKPEECIGALSQSGRPLIGLRSQHRAWLLALTEVGDPKIRTLHREDDQSKSIDLSFGISESKGLFVGLISETTPSVVEDDIKTISQKTLTIRQYSLQGQESEITQVSSIPLGSNTELIWFNDNPYISTRSEKSLQLWSTKDMIWSTKATGIHTFRIQQKGLQMWSIQDGSLAVEQIAVPDHTETEP